MLGVNLEVWVFKCKHAYGELGYLLCISINVSPLSQISSTINVFSVGSNTKGKSNLCESITAGIKPPLGKPIIESICG